MRFSSLLSKTRLKVHFWKMLNFVVERDIDEKEDLRCLRRETGQDLGFLFLVMGKRRE